MATYVPAGLLVQAMHEVSDNIAGQAQGTVDVWAVPIDQPVIDWLIANLPANTIIGNYLAAQLQPPHSQTVRAEAGTAAETMGEIWTV